MTAHRPQGDRQADALNQVLVNKLRVFCSHPARAHAWDVAVQEAAFAYNTFVHTAHHHTPYFWVMSDALLQCTLCYGLPPSRLSLVRITELLCRNIKRVCDDERYARGCCTRTRPPAQQHPNHAHERDANEILAAGLPDATVQGELALVSLGSLLAALSRDTETPVKLTVQTSIHQ